MRLLIQRDQAYETLQLENRNHLAFQTRWRWDWRMQKSWGVKKAEWQLFISGCFRCRDEELRRQNPGEDKRAIKTATNNHRRPKFASEAANPVPLITWGCARSISADEEGDFDQLLQQVEIVRVRK
ncbi:hypothetical protein ACP275_03G035100 [Erythranthe tilingii]